ncbi:MAG: hypothetical protein PVI21_06330 [Candidatus Woesebacteria bacterium]|jgi:pimeloyl-ACP methyl ester carboxylesterase
MNSQPVFIIPERKLKTDHPVYANLRGALRSNGFTIEGCDLVWSSGTMGGWSGDVTRVVKDSGPAIMFSFGLGGMIALETSVKTPIKKLILCSPGGYYKEYINQQDYIVKRWVGDARLAEFSQMSVQDLFANMQVEEGLVIVDESEFIGRPAYKQWIDDLIGATNWEIIRLPRQRFGMASPGFQKVIVDTVKTLPSAVSE